jgi:pimeloyl-ACP methyl ester carboxylesterase
MPQQLNVRHAGAGLPVVLLHAFPASSRMFEAQRRSLADLCHVITPDLRGFGGNEVHDLHVGDAPDLDRMAEDVAETLHCFGVRRAVIGGVSMGGYVAMAFARRYPDMLEGLILADTKAVADTAEQAAARERIASTVLREHSVRVLVEELLPKLVGRTSAAQRPQVLAEIRQMVEQAHPVGVVWAERAMAARGDSREVLRKVTVPSLVMVGEEDAVTPPAEARAMAAELPGAEMVVLPGGGHFSAMEVPAEFDMTLRRWLRKL